jgi:hypothetical protein
VDFFVVLLPVDAVVLRFSSTELHAAKVKKSMAKQAANAIALKNFFISLTFQKIIKLYFNYIIISPAVQGSAPNLKIFARGY